MSSQVHNENIVIVVDFNKKNEMRITDLYFRQKVNFG